MEFFRRYGRGKVVIFSWSVLFELSEFQTESRPPFVIIRMLEFNVGGIYALLHIICIIR